MIRIGNSKEPTPKQMLNIVSNLGNKFDLTVNIEIDCWQFSTRSEITFKLYIDTKGIIITTDSWPELLKEYRRLMKEEL